MKSSSIAIITVVVIVVLILVSFMGYLVYFKDGKECVKYVELLPIIGILVGIITLIIGVFSILGGYLLDRVLEERAAKFIEEKARTRADVSAMRAHIEVGHVYYLLSKKDPLFLNISMKERFIDMAIEEQYSILKFKGIEEYWECYAKNNLGFLHAIRDRSEEDRDLARIYSKFVFEKSLDYLFSEPEDAIEWRMTRAYVMARHAEKPEEVEKARKVYQSLLILGRVSPEQERRIKAHIKNFWP